MQSSYIWSSPHDRPIRFLIGIPGIQPDKFETSWLRPTTRAGQVCLLKGLNNWRQFYSIPNLPLKYKIVNIIPGIASAQTVETEAEQIPASRANKSNGQIPPHATRSMNPISINFLAA